MSEIQYLATRKMIPFVIAALMLRIGTTDGTSDLQLAQEESSVYSIQLDPYYLRFDSIPKGGSCDIEGGELGVATKDHIRAFFESEGSLKSLHLSADLLGIEEKVFACQDGTIVRISGSAQYRISSEAESRIMRHLFDYLSRTRKSYALLLRKLGWEDLNTVTILTRSGDVVATSDTWKYNRASDVPYDSGNWLFLVLITGLSCIALISVVVIYICACRKRSRRIGRNLESQDLEDASNHSIVPTERKNKIDRDTRRSTEPSSGLKITKSEQEERTIHLGEDLKSTGNNNLLESTGTVAMHRTSAFWLSHILGSCSSDELELRSDSFGSVKSRPTSLLDRHTESRTSVIAGTSDADGSAILPSSRTISGLAARTSSQPKTSYIGKQKIPPKLSESPFSDSTPFPILGKERALLSLTGSSAFNVCIKSNAETDMREFEATSYLPSFMTGSLRSPLSTGEEESLSSKQITISHQQIIKTIELGQANSMEDEELKCSGTHDDARNIKSKGFHLEIKSAADTEKMSSPRRSSLAPPIHRRYCFSQKEELVKEDVDPMVPQVDEVTNLFTPISMKRVSSWSSNRVVRVDSGGDSDLDGQADVDPVFSVSQPGSCHNSRSNEDFDLDDLESGWDDLEDCATDGSPPERVYYFAG